jgi:hypothetical protein
MPGQHQLVPLLDEVIHVSEPSDVVILKKDVPILRWTRRVGVLPIGVLAVPRQARSSGEVISVLLVDVTEWRGLRIDGN